MYQNQLNLKIYTGFTYDSDKFLFDFESSFKQ